MAKKRSCPPPPDLYKRPPPPPATPAKKALGESGIASMTTEGVKMQPAQHTIYKDHTGRWIRDGDKCEMDARHAHCDDWKGSICLINNELTFRHDESELGDVPVKDCFGLLEVMRNEDRGAGRLLKRMRE